MTHSASGLWYSVALAFFFSVRSLTSKARRVLRLRLISGKSRVLSKLKHKQLEIECDFKKVQLSAKSFGLIVAFDGRRQSIQFLFETVASGSWASSHCCHFSTEIERDRVYFLLKDLIPRPSQLHLAHCNQTNHGG